MTFPSILGPPSGYGWRLQAQSFSGRSGTFVTPADTQDWSTFRVTVLNSGGPQGYVPLWSLSVSETSSISMGIMTGFVANQPIPVIIPTTGPGTPGVVTIEFFTRERT